MVRIFLFALRMWQIRLSARRRGALPWRWLSKGIWNVYGNAIIHGTGDKWMQNFCLEKRKGLVLYGKIILKWILISRLQDFFLSLLKSSEYRALYKLIGWLHWVVCGKCIQSCIFLLKLIHASDWVWLLIHEVSRRTTVGRSPLYEWSARHRGLYLTTYNTHNRQTSMRPVGFEPTTPASERSQTYALDRAATGTGSLQYTDWIILAEHMMHWRFF